MAKTHPRHQCFNSDFSSQHLHHLDAITTLLGWSCCPHERSLPLKETALQRTIFGQAPLRRLEKSTSKKHWWSPWNLSVSPLIAWNIGHKTKTSGMKLSNLEQKSMKQEEMQQLSCTGNLEKALPHQPLLPPFLNLTAEDTYAHRLISLAICTLTDPVLNHMVNQMVLIDYYGQRRRFQFNTNNLQTNQFDS